MADDLQDSNNNIIWKKTFGGSQDDGAFSIIETSDHCFIFVASSTSNDGDVTGNHGDEDIWIVKIDSLGTLQWQKSIGGTGWDNPFSIIQDDDGNIMVLGLTSSSDGDVNLNHGAEDFWLLKLNSSGNLVWQKTFGGSDADWGYQVIQTLDGGYILAGFTLSSNGDVSFNHGFEDIWLVKINNIGNIQWQHSYGGSESDQLDNIIKLSTGNFIFAGTTASMDGDVLNSINGPDFWTVEIDSLGTIINQACFGGSDLDIAWSLIQTNDGGYAVAGETYSNDHDVVGNHGDADCWIVKLDQTLNKQWQLCLGGSDEDVAYKIAQLSNSDFVVSGYSFSNDGDVTGNHGGGFEDIWSVRLGTSLNTSGFSVDQKIIFYPNPSSDIINVTFSSEYFPILLIIYDQLGNSIFSQNIISENFKLLVDFLNPGVYFFEATFNGSIIRKKFIKVNKLF